MEQTKRYLWTYDSSMDRPERDCKLYAGDKLPELSKGERWEAIEFGDCWTALYWKPEIDDDGTTLIGLKNIDVFCRVKKPGTHPGGNCWWCTPVEPVYITMGTPEE